MLNNGVAAPPDDIAKVEESELERGEDRCNPNPVTFNYTESETPTKEILVDTDEECKDKGFKDLS